jgi:hypothetical protein
LPKLRPRKSPCASCPFRRDVPSGVWAESEYEKLRAYDGTTGEQAMAGALGAFLCHNDPDRSICAGWAALSNTDTLALRLANSMDRDVDVIACLDYSTDVPLFSSGAEAADHGEREIEAPSEKASRVIGKVTKVRARSSKPVQTGE